MGKNIEIGKKKNWFGHLHSKISGLVKVRIESISCGCEYLFKIGNNVVFQLL